MKRPLLFALLLALAAGCRPDCTPRDPARPNVVLITVDTLRADHVGAYGNAHAGTPHIDRLAAEGRVFDASYAVCHTTVPSHTSIFTSRPLTEHRVLSNLTPLPAPVPNLVRSYHDAGWHTGAFVGARHLGPSYALGQLLAPSLDVYDAPRRGSQPRRAADTTAALSQWIRGVCREPFFAWVHYWDPHMPYDPPSPWDHEDPETPTRTPLDRAQLPWALYDLRPVRAALQRRPRAVREVKALLPPGMGSHGVRRLLLNDIAVTAYVDGPARERAHARLHALADGIRAELPLVPNLSDWLNGVADVETAHARYVGEVRSVDAAIGTLRAELERLDLAQRTLVVVTADHGEGLGEHGIWFNHEVLLEPHLRVPLVVWGPGRVAPGREATPVDGLDVAPTVLGLAGLPVPDGMRGRDLLHGAIVPRPLVSEGINGRQVGVMADGWRLVRSVGPITVGSFEREPGRVELYDRTRDPAELDDRAASEPARVQAMQAAIDAWLAPRGGTAGSPGAVSRERADELRALGYVE